MTSAGGGQLGLEGYLTTIAFVALIATAAVLDVSRRSELRLAQSAFVPPPEERAPKAVKAFGWASRQPIGQDRLAAEALQLRVHGSIGVLRRAAGTAHASHGHRRPPC